MDSRKSYVRSDRFNCPQNPDILYVEKILRIIALLNPLIMKEVD